MQRQITPDQCYCSFGDGLVYTFVPYDNNTRPTPCVVCSFRDRVGLLNESVKCYAVPCQKLHRRDKMDGFWRLSKDVDYQAFEKMLENGG